MAIAGVRLFSDLPAFLARDKSRAGCFVDTSVLFSETYPLDIFNEECEKAFDVLAQFEVSVITNISVRAEFLENHRRVLIAECLIDVLDEWGPFLDGRLLEKLKSHKTLSRRKVEEDKSIKMELSQIKNFRRLLSSFNKDGQNGWSLFCLNFLHGKLSQVWTHAEDELGINFISVRSSDKSPFLNQIPEWETVVDLMGRYGLGSNDAMILNIFLCSNVPLLLTSDIELAETAALESKGSKNIFIPDSALTGGPKSPISTNSTP